MFPEQFHERQLLMGSCSRRKYSGNYSEVIVQEANAREGGGGGLGNFPGGNFIGGNCWWDSCLGGQCPYTLKYI